VRLSVTDDGWQIKVLDNGSGIEKSDLAIAFARHATSKIANASDLQNLSTLGFRGEALPSIAAVSIVEIKSRTQDAMEGWHMTVTDGFPGKTEPTGMPIGTQITINKLFYNTPARRKFLKSAALENGHITSLLAKMILSHPDIAFTLSRDDRIILRSSGDGSLKQAILAVYGSDVAAALTPLQGESADIKVSGLVSLPPFSRTSRKYYHIFINGRLVQSHDVNNIIDTAYRTLLPEKRYPAVVLHIALPPQDIDVNVHPAKLEVRIQKETVLRLAECLLEAFRQALTWTPQTVVPLAGKASHIPLPLLKDGPPLCAAQPTANTETTFTPQTVEKSNTEGIFKQMLSALPQNYSDKVTEDNFASQLFSGLTGVGTDRTEVSLNSAVTEDKNNIRPEKENFASLLFSGLTGARTNLPNAPVQTNEITKPYKQKLINGIEPEQITLPEPESIYGRLEPLGQLDSAYIIATLAADLYIIDQHAAHERLRYEKFQKQYAGTGSATEFLTVPYKLELGSLQAEILINNITALTGLGFILEHFGGHTFLLRGIPAWYQGEDAPEELLFGLLDKAEEGNMTLSKFTPEQLFSMACHSAVRGKQRLTWPEIAWLLKELAACPQALTCPHGRPIIIKISAAEIIKRFMRS